MFREVFALEKLHGTSSNLALNADGRLHLFPGGGTLAKFEALFPPKNELEQTFKDVLAPGSTVYGEFYGGGGQVGMKMSDTYGKTAKFAVFDVQVGGLWLAVPRMQAVADKLGLEAVHWEKIPATVEAIDAARDADSVQAVRNGMGHGHLREGVILRPLVEMTKNNGERVIAKHKRPEFTERQNQPPVVDPNKLQVMEDASRIAVEWVVPMRLVHVLQKMNPPAVGMNDTGRVMAAMTEDVLREAAGEILVDKTVTTAIGRKAVELFHAHIRKG